MFSLSFCFSLFLSFPLCLNISFPPSFLLIPCVSVGSGKKKLPFKIRLISLRASQQIIQRQLQPPLHSLSVSVRL